ncbi:hypothetical protein [Pseudothauera rhizosphaerae]|uniref:Uncharacterized protein n=1 Tax=Pseudothauera rhizosphaerae TaxID=2565932 RepID=A0A4S4AR83_9RHOO|nr:hypothetical protein [Pseudothauera rhizosphaerae]THF62244.1 hypothetical protein E6O51_08830 [Pseudothauera rhizosphaerae]
MKSSLASLQAIRDRLLAQDLELAGAVPDDNWSEEIVLHDGSALKLERNVSYTLSHSFGDAGSGYQLSRNKLRKHQLRFTHPKNGEILTWQGEVSVEPVLLDVVDGTPYIVLAARPTKEVAQIYGCTELPFIYLRHDHKQRNVWHPVPLDRAPDSLKRMNISIIGDKSPKQHLSAAEIDETIAKKIRSSERFFQHEIPRSYKEWSYVYKDSYRNERRRDDCRPPRVPLPQAVLPLPVEGSPEVLESVEYTPERIVAWDEWSSLVSDKKRQGECKKVFRPADPGDRMQGQRFVHDKTGNKQVPYSRTAQFDSGVKVLCDEYVWFITHLEEPGKMVVSRYTIAGDLVSRISFRKPEKIGPFIGHIRAPSLHTKDGYMYFDWHDFQSNGRTWHIRRWLKMRMKEPVALDRPAAKN